MAARQLVLSDALCFILNKFGKTGRNELNTLRHTVVDFYHDTSIITAAKCQLLADMDNIMFDDNDKPPRIPQRRESTDRALIEVDDIFKLLNFLDERKLMDKLPLYVTDNPDSIPSTKLCEGDLKFLFMFMDRMEGRMQGHSAQLAAITRDVRALMRTETRPVEVVFQAPPPVQPTSTSSVIQRPNNHSSGARSAASAPGGSRPNVSQHTQSSQPAGDKGYMDKTNAGNSHVVHSSAMYWADESAGEGPAFVAVESRRARSKKRKLQRSNQQQQESAAEASADASSTERGNPGNRPSGRRRVQRAPLIVGKADSGSLDQITAAKPLIKKAVFCVDNVKPDFTPDQLQKYVSDMSVSVVSCHKVDSRRRRYETKEEVAKDRIAFRLCIHAEDRDNLLDANKWPEHVVISEWFFAPSKKGAKPRSGGANGGTRDHKKSAGAGDDDENGLDMDETIIDGTSGAEFNNNSYGGS